LNDSIVYNIPVSMLEPYRGRKLIVRSHDPAEIVQRLAAHDLENIAYLQVLGAGGNLDDLLRWEQPVAVDLVVENPEADLPLLYRFSPLLVDRPVRVSVPVAPGFGKVVTLALSLNFAVKLEPSQPSPGLIVELLQVAERYLHQSTVSQPVEFLHSMFLAFYHEEPVSLWAVQEEDPSRDRFVTDQGVEIISKRLAGVDLKHDLTTFITGFTEELLEEKRECRDCRFFEVCLGYFKWPRKEYRCDGVKTLFQTLWEAAEELKADLSACRCRKGEGRP
jgi:hypothetical protein